MFTIRNIMHGAGGLLFFTVYKHFVENLLEKHFCYPSVGYINLILHFKVGFK